MTLKFDLETTKTTSVGVRIDYIDMRKIGKLSQKYVKFYIV